MDLKRALLGAAMLLAASCRVAAVGPPDIVVDRTPCSHCGMLISEPLYAAAYETAAGEPRVFDDLGCLRNAARTGGAERRVWVHDAATGAWMDGAEAIFVSSSEIRTPMGGGFLAYRRLEDAERAAAKHKGRIIRSLRELLASTEAGS